VSKERDLWRFVAANLKRGDPVVLLVVAESSGSSPGRAGYKMAVARNGELCGSIGGGVMEVNLVEQAKSDLSELDARAATARETKLNEQVHQRNAQNASGMICSGRQSVISRILTAADTDIVEHILRSNESKATVALSITDQNMFAGPPSSDAERIAFHKSSQTDFAYTEQLRKTNDLVIIGGGHCSLALSELMSGMDFHITVFDDRPGLNTISKNEFADEINIIEKYEYIHEQIRLTSQTYVVVMTLGYRSDETVIRSLLDKDFKYFGVLGSRAKMKTLLAALAEDGFPADKLASIHTPIGLPINSQTPEEIAVSIAAEIIQVKNTSRSPH